MGKYIADLKFLRRSKTLEVVFDNDEVVELPYEFLRIFSPSAEVRGHSPSQAVIQTGKREVNIAKIENVGNYAIQIFFDDGHSSGIYAFDYLCELATNKDKLWAEYLKTLEVNNIDRDTAMTKPASKSCGN